MMLGARTAAWVKSGEVMSEQFKNFIIGGNAIVGAFDGSAITTNFTSRQHLFSGLRSMTSCSMPTMTASNYCFWNCSALTFCKVHAVVNNGTVFLGCSSLATLQLGQAASVIIGYTNFLDTLPHTCVVECYEADIKYIDSAWNIVQRT